MKKKLVIAVPVHDMIHATFASDAMVLCLYIGSRLGAEWMVQIRGVLGTYIHIARQQLLEAAIADEADYVLWLDGDMRFPADGFQRLLSHNVPMVGINYSTRRLPTRFTAIEHTTWTSQIGAVEHLVTRPESTGLARVDALGFGMVLMDLNAIKPALPDPKEEPWFWYEWKDSGQNVGEDVYFCRLLERAGIPIYVDHDLSKLCAHSGQIDYMTNHALLFKDGVAVMPEKVEAPTLMSSAS